MTAVRFVIAAGFLLALSTAFALRIEDRWEPTTHVVRSRPMRIREENRNMFLLATVTLCCGAVAGTLTLLEPVLQPAPERQVAERTVAERTVIDVTRISDQRPVRVVGAPFEPNVNPRER